jgi:CRP-like cAMP-binding protein
MAAEPLSSHEVFSFLRPQQVKAISDVSEVVTFAEGEMVFRSGEPAISLYAVLEGSVSLDLPRGDGASLHIDDAPARALFGSCVCFDRDTYAMTATCTVETKLLRISADRLRQVMDEDPATGYQVQRMISRTYFARYLDTAMKLQSIAEALALAPDRRRDGRKGGSP